MTTLKETLEAELGRKLKIAAGGKCVCEADGDGWLVMTPDGEIEFAPTKKKASKICSDYFEANMTGDINVGSIEWRT